MCAICSLNTTNMEYQFKAKSIKTGDWVYGYLIKVPSEYTMYTIGKEMYIDPTMPFSKHYKRYLINAIQEYDEFGNITVHKVDSKTIQLVNQ